MTPAIRNKSGWPSISDAQLTSSRRRAGTQGCSAAGWHAGKHCTVLHAADALNPGIFMQTMRRVALRGTQGYSRVSTRLLDGEHATSTVARATINRCVHAAWQLHPPAMRLRDGIKQWRTAHPLLLLCVHAIVRRLAVEWGRSAEQGARRTFTPS